MSRPRFNVSRDSIGFSLVPVGSCFWDPETLCIFKKDGPKSSILMTRMPGMPYEPGTEFPVFHEKTVCLAEEVAR